MASDYLMRQIEDMARLCSEVLFAKHTEPLPVFDEQGNVTENGVLYGRLRGKHRPAEPGFQRCHCGGFPHGYQEPAGRGD